MKQTNKLFNYCVKHPVFAHILLILIVSIGLVGIQNIQTQLIPNLSIPQLYTNFFWPGADASQVERNILIPAEDATQDLVGLKNMIAVSRASNGTLVLKFEQSQNMQDAKQKAIQAFDNTDFPKDMEDYTIQVIEPKELIARLSFTSPEEKLEEISRKIKTSLNNQGIRSIQMFGIPEYELHLEINPTWLQNHPISINQLVSAIQAMLNNNPAGFAGEKGQYAASEVGIPMQDLIGLNWSISLTGDPALIPARQIFSQAALINSENAIQYTQGGKHLAEIRVFRSAQEDLITIAQQLNTWLDLYASDYADYNLDVYSQTWKYFIDRMMLILKNGGAGLILILALLTLFLNGRYAVWVAAGLPISILGTIAFMYILGFHISMISMFAIILSLGIIVDDAIVVAEQAASYQHQHPSQDACVLAATQMFKPVITSSMTTLAAFFPLLFISGVAGQFLREIPIVVITVIVASLIECFLILPKHLSTVKVTKTKITKSRVLFRHFRVFQFLPLIRYAITHRLLVIVSAISFILITVSLILTSRIQFSFFPDFSSEQVIIEVRFDPSTTFADQQRYLHELELAIEHTSQSFTEPILDHYHIVMNQRLNERIQANSITDGVHIWLTDQDKRSVKNSEFVKVLRENTPKSAFVETLSIDQPRGGPPSDQIQIELSGQHENIVAAADELKSILRTFVGLYDVNDNAASSIPNYFYSLEEMAIISGLNTQALYQQVQSYLNENRNWSLNLNGEDIDIVISTPDQTKSYSSQIDEIPIQVGSKSILPLNAVSEKIKTYIPQILIRKEQVRTYTVSARVDSSITNTYAVDAELQSHILPKILAKYEVTSSIGEIKQDQSKTIAELKAGAIIGFAVIYLVLVWSLGSFVQPLAILLTLPLALTGGILGHWFLGFDITLLSLFGFFGLAGVTVNDSIILSLKYQSLRKNLQQSQALIRASYLRFRAVILTSLTTIGGLLPLMFETSFQAQFIIPMAITIAFGLLFGTLWILIFLPAILSLIPSKD